MKSLFKNEQSGRSMVEMLGVLAIIGVLSVGGISGYSKAMAKFKLTKAQDQLSMMIMNIRTAFATSPGYPGLNVTTAIDYKLVSQEMVASSKALINAFGGTTLVSAVKGADKTENGAFQIVFQGLGKDVCVSLATSDWGTDGLLGIGVASTSIAINDDIAAKASTSFKGGGSLASPNALPLSIADVRADSACGSDNTNSITWVYN